MSEQHYKNYVWRNGKPYGVTPSIAKKETFRVLADPYNKWISVESYKNGHYIETIYDSKSIDFRTLSEPAHIQWQKIDLKDGRTLLRDENDRARLIEEYIYEGEECKGSRCYSPNNQFLFQTEIYLESKGKSFNGVVLLDKTSRPVLIKKYSLNQLDGSFETLLLEDWSPTF